MRVLLFGATGMIGGGVLRECLLAPDVTEVVSVGRRTTGASQPKLRELAVPDLADLGSIETELAGVDACFYCMGVSSAGMSEADYRRLTVDMPLAAAVALARRSPRAVLVYVSGAGTDSTEKGRTMWARVKGAAENALMRQPLKAAYMFRPGLIQPLHGVVSRTPAYRAAYVVLRPFWPLLRIFPSASVTTEEMGLAMLNAARRGYPKPVLEVADIHALAR